MLPLVTNLIFDNMGQYYKSQVLKVLYAQIFLLIYKLIPFVVLDCILKNYPEKMSTCEALKSH